MEPRSDFSPYSLGIDLGTTSVKFSIVDGERLIESVSDTTNAYITSNIGQVGFEQNPALILDSVQKCLRSISSEVLSKVGKIGVTGQMHGVLLWSSKDVLNFYNRDMQKFCVARVSPLYTWQDQRCDQAFLASLPKPVSHLPLSTGHGNATLFWLSRQQPESLLSYDSAGTIMDFLVAILCGLKAPVMTDQLAASWGYFDSKSHTWNRNILEEASFPCNLLPSLTRSGTKAGKLQFDWLHIRAGTVVMAALGDTQCAVFSALKESHEAVLNLGTSCQLAFSVKSDDVPQIADPHSPVQFFPYFNNKYLAVAASLNGGNVLSSFVAMIKQWLHYFGCEKTDDDIWNALSQSSVTDECTETSLKIFPTIFGERHAPCQMGQISGITHENMDVNGVYKSTCKGLIANIHQMMPPSFLCQYGIQTMIGVGSVIVKNDVIRKEIEQQYGELDLILGRSCDSAVGVAVFTATS